MLREAKRKVIAKEKLPLLSTPTEEPSFVSLESLVERLGSYKHANVLPDSWDYQIAISRCKISPTLNARLSIEKKTAGESQRILKFLTEPVEPEGPIHSRELWMTAALTKNPVNDYPTLHPFGYTKFYQRLAEFSWRSFNEHYQISKYNYSKRKNEKVPAERMVLRIEKIKADQPSLLQTFVQKIFKKNEKATSPLSFIYDFTLLGANWLSAEHNDIERLVYLFPNNPEPLLAKVISRCLESNNFSGELERKLVSKTLESLLNLSVRWTEIGHLLIATCMLSGDKTVKSFAAELWIQGVRKKILSSERIGQIIGIHQSIEFAPMKRFTDLISASMFQISAEHNHELELLLVSMLVHLPDQPVAGLKKLLELFAELSYANRSQSSNRELQQKFNIWLENGESLHKPLKTLIAHI